MFKATSPALPPHSVANTFLPSLRDAVRAKGCNKHPDGGCAGRVLPQVIAPEGYLTGGGSSRPHQAKKSLSARFCSLPSIVMQGGEAAEASLAAKSSRTINTSGKNETKNDRIPCFDWQRECTSCVLEMLIG